MRWDETRKVVFHRFYCPGEFFWWFNYFFVGWLNNEKSFYLHRGLFADSRDINPSSSWQFFFLAYPLPLRLQLFSCGGNQLREKSRKQFSFTSTERRRLMKPSREDECNLADCFSQLARGECDFDLLIWLGSSHWRLPIKHFGAIFF